MKKLLSLLTIASMLTASSTAIANEEKTISVTVDGNPVYFDSQPMIVNDRTLVPMRNIFEALGATVSWDGENQSVTSYLCGISLVMNIGSTSLYKAGTYIEMDVAPVIYNDYTYIPLRAASEGLGAVVEWDGENNSIAIKSNPKLGYDFYDDGKTYYAGEFENGVKNGYGTFFYNSGNVAYFGQVQNDVPHGRGVFYSEDKNISIDGNFVNSNAEGYGLLILDNSRYLNGIFSNGVFLTGSNSDVFEYNANSQITYIGHLNENYQYDGYGSLYSPHTGGLIYEGNFSDNVYDGYGTLYDGYGNILYTGMMYGGLTAQEAYNEDLQTLQIEYQEKLNELYEFQTSDPFQTDWAQSIMERYTYDTNSSGNVDSYSAANALRQQEALRKKGEELVLQEFNNRISTMQTSINEWYAAGVRQLKMKYNI